MAQIPQKECYYCGCKTTGFMCGICKQKLKVLRQIRKMVKKAVNECRPKEKKGKRASEYGTQQTDTKSKNT